MSDEARRVAANVAKLSVADTTIYSGENPTLVLDERLK